MKIFLLITSVFIGSLAFGTGPELPEYYGSEFYEGYQNGNLKNEQLLGTLHQILASSHKVLGYDKARRVLFGELFLEKISGSWAVKDVYCERTFTSQELNIGPGKIPDGNVINTEHTWPQSRFTSRFPKEMQKSDLHHLFPTDNEMNSRRGNMRFGDVEEPVESLKCPVAELGHGDTGEIVFEAPPRHKGNVARALFYFATRYKMKISPTEETDLRLWNEQDPVDEAEFIRNEQIYKAQGDRNPFIDFPDLIQRIERF